MIEKREEPTARIELHRDLQVWQRAMELAVEVHRLAAKFPSMENHRLAA